MERELDVTRESYTLLGDGDQRTQLLQMALILAVVTEKPLATRLGDSQAVIRYMMSITAGSPLPALGFTQSFLEGPGAKVLSDLAAPKAAVVATADFLQGEYYNDPSSHRARVNALLSKL
jgi:hypothetical protein